MCFLSFTDLWQLPSKDSPLPTQSLPIGKLLFLSFPFGEPLTWRSSAFSCVFFTRQFYLESLFLLAGEGQAGGDILVLLLGPRLPPGSEELQIEDFLVKV